jgi:hypothetical protein
MGSAQSCKSFLVLFFKKEHASFFAQRPRTLTGLDTAAAWTLATVPRRAGAGALRTAYAGRAASWLAGGA